MKNIIKVISILGLIAVINLGVSTFKEGGAKASTSKAFTHTIYISVVGGAK